ncbi:MAG: [Bacteroidales bacterium]|nr:[FeFe] hydrogenase H-cluster maturation GTPase HydF [Bacteroidales bacterium]
MEVRNIIVLGRRNVGKSSLVNLLTGQNVSIVSDVAGTTTDPVRKRMEIKGVGPCNIVDTAGVDDSGDVGALRSDASLRQVVGADLALLVFTGNTFGDYERALAEALKKSKAPFILVHNQEDIEHLEEDVRASLSDEFMCPVVRFTCLKNISEMYISELVDAISGLLKSSGESDMDLVPKSLAGEGDRVLLVCPIDEGAPEGRLILPQVQVLRSLLDNKAVVTVIQPSELKDVFPGGKYKVVITDSQAFSEVAAAVPKGIPVGSFSILFARRKGPFKLFMESVAAIDLLKDGDKVLIMESCTHRASCDDIGRVKIPALLRRFTGKELSFEFVSGNDPLPEDFQSFAIALQCGGCMATATQISSRVAAVAENNVPVTNYGLAIAYMKGLFSNCNFKEFLKLVSEK